MLAGHVLRISVSSKSMTPKVPLKSWTTTALKNKDYSRNNAKINLFTLLCEICTRKASRTNIEKLTDEDWEALWILSIRHKVASIMVSSFRELQVTIPKKIEFQARRHTLNNLMKSMHQSAELVRLSKLFNKHNIRFLCFKGLAVVGLLELEFGQRHCGDMDILLIDPTDLILADQLLRKEGYERMIKGVENSMLNNHQILGQFNAKDLGYSNVSKGIELELHIALFTTTLLPVALDEIYMNREEILIANNPIPVMSQEDHLLYLLLHGSNTAWHRLKWLLDIPLVSNNGASYRDKEFISRSEKLGVQRMVLQGLGLAHKLLDMPISGETANKLSSVGITAMHTKFAIKTLLSEKSPYDNRRGKYFFHGVFLYCVYQPTLRVEISYKLRCVNKLFLSLRDYKMFPLTPNLYWLYYPLSPILWLTRFLKKSG